MFNRTSIGLFVCLVLALPGVAQERTHAITPADYASIRNIGEFKIHPKLEQHPIVAFTLASWDERENSRKTEIFYSYLRGDVPPATGHDLPAYQLTFDRGNDRKLRWAAHGQELYVLANRKRAGETNPPYDGTTQVWAITFPAGHIRPITKHPGGVADFDYAPQSDTIFYTVDTTHADADDFAKLRTTYNKVEYGHGVRTVSKMMKQRPHLLIADTVLDEQRYIREFVVSHDGQQIAMVTAYDDTVVKSEGESRVDVWHAGRVVTPPTECYRAQAASPYAWLENLVWNQDASKFAFIAVHDAYPAEVILGERSGSSWSTKRLERNHEWQVVGYGRALGAPVQFLPNDLLAIATDRAGRTGLRITTTQGEALHADVYPEMQLQAIEFVHTEAGKYGCLAVVSSSTHFPQLVQFIFDLNAKSNELKPFVVFDPNEHTKPWKLPTVKHITWKAADGATVGGVLELPSDYKPGEKLPLVVAIHGGPTTATKADLNFDPHNGRVYFSAAGYAVLLPNYRGSTGYGDQFLIDLVGNENDLEVKDILAGIQHLITEGIADGERVGVMGWSNGGYLTNCLITLKNPPVKIKAASSGAGIVDTVAEWGFNDEPAYPIVFKKGLPWEQAEIYKKTSPTYGLGNVTTPTIIHVGGADERCPPGHSRMLYRALKENLNVPTELIVYTGEPHGLGKLSNRRAKMEWDLAWFAKYLQK